jgi:hypothetical protein
VISVQATASVFDTVPNCGLEKEFSFGLNLLQMQPHDTPCKCKDG